MRCKIQCDVCGATCWTTGEDEQDIGVVTLDEDDPLDDGCSHMQDGGAVTIIETEDDSDED